jgi:peptidoglycan/LPS O-acetylase OafA/YrhL
VALVSYQIFFFGESGYFDNAGETKPLLHLWSLAIEEQFYIFLPLILWYGWKARFNLLTLMVVIAIISMVLNIWEINTDVVATFYSPQTRFWELLLGSVLAQLTLGHYPKINQFKHQIDLWLGKIVYHEAPESTGQTLSNTQASLGALLIIGSILSFNKSIHFPGWWALLPTFGAVLIISAGNQTWLNRIVLSNPLFVWFGLISFPLYLWHWPLLSFAQILSNETPSRELRVFLVIIAIFLAWLTYYLIEKPIRSSTHKKSQAVVLFMLAMCMLFIGYNTYRRDGLGFRLPKLVQEFTQYKYNFDNFSLAYRKGSCFLTPEQDFTAFNTCESKGKNKQTLILWGDSHAASLYPGYENSLSNTLKIVQRTTSSCPPILSYDNNSTTCRKINDYIFDEIQKIKPDKVVLSAAWPNYGDVYKRVADTITQLHKIGIKNIDLVGPLPQWNDSLPRQLYLNYKASNPHQIPDRMKFGLNQNFIQMDILLANISARLNVHYISPKNILCNDRGCITRLGDTGDTLIS